MPRIQSLIPLPNGAIRAVNRASLAEVPYWLTPDALNNSIVVPANQGSPLTAFTLSGEGPMEIMNFAAEVLRAGAIVTNSRMRAFIQIQDGQSQRALMNGACHVNTIFGTGAQPFRLAEGLYIDELRSLLMAFTDLSGTDTTIRPVVLGSRFLTQQADNNLTRIRQRLEQRQYLSMPYFYTLDQTPPSIAAATQSQFTITIDQDAHFEIHKLSIFREETAVPGTSGPADINILDISKGESIIDGTLGSNYPISIDLLMGNGNFPFVLFTPRLIQLRTRLLVTINNRHVNAQTFYVTLHGRALANRMWKS